MSTAPGSARDVHEVHETRDAHDPPVESAPLVVVRGLSETVVAGYGNAMLYLRTLDDVSLDVRAGDLVLLSGRVGEGAAALAGALAGHRRIMHGARDVHPGVRVRRGVVSSDAHRAIIDGWAAGRATRCVHDDAAHSRTAYVLRVRHPSRHPSTRGPRPGATDAGCDGPPPRCMPDRLFAWRMVRLGACAL